MERYSTAGMPIAGRAAAWNVLYASRMSQVEFTPGDRNKFDAELSIGQLGPVKLARLTVDRCSVERSQLHSPPKGPRLYNVLLQAEGDSTFVHCGHESHLSEGDLVLVDTALPHYFRTQDRSVTIMARVPSDRLREHLPSPEQYCGVRLGHAVGVTGAVAAMMKELSAKVESGIEAGYEARVARSLLEMVSLSYDMGFNSAARGSPMRWRRRAEVIRYIEDHLRDPELSPASIAAGLRLTPRYLRMIFSISGEKVSDYILRRRLEECARQVGNPSWSSHTLLEIAFSWGFNSAAYFTRCFRDQFGVAPRDYRRAAVD